MKTINCIIIDDEPLAIQLIENHISKFDNFSVINVFSDSSDALVFFQTPSFLKVQVIFLDIQMPQVNGLEIINLLNPKPLIVLTTAYSEFAVQGFEMEVLDYLIKPITFNRFSKTISKIKQNLTENTIAKDYIYLKHNSQYIKVDFSSIHYIKSRREIMMMRLNDRTLILSDYTMKLFESELPKSLFMRVHKSYIIATSKITLIRENSVEIANESIPIGNLYKKDFLNNIRTNLL